MTLEYFRLESGLLVAFLGANGFEGVLAYRENGWVYHAWGSTTWDSWHQQAYLAHRADSVPPEKIGVPPPDTTRIQPRSVTWESNFATWLNFYEFTEQQLAWLRPQRRLWLIMFEDLYETSFGDGCYIYLHSVYWEEAMARSAFSELESDKKFRYTFKPIVVKVNDQRQRVIGEMDLKQFERLHLHEVMKKLFS